MLQYFIWVKLFFKIYLCKNKKQANWITFKSKSKTNTKHLWWPPDQPSVLCKSISLFQIKHRNEIDFFALWLVTRPMTEKGFQLWIVMPHQWCIGIYNNFSRGGNFLRFSRGHWLPLWTPKKWPPKHWKLSKTNFLYPKGENTPVAPPPPSVNSPCMMLDTS